jgi:hypothetical protein
MKSKTVKELKEKIEAEVKEDFDFEQHLFKKYPDLFYKGEDGELLPQFQRCWNDCPKGWEPLIDDLCGAIDDYIKNTSRSELNPNRKIKTLVYKKIWQPIKSKVNAIFNPYHDFKIRKFASPTPEQKAKMDKLFSMKVRRFTSRISAWFMSDMYVYNIKPPTVKVAQYKEKYGTLRFYADGGDETVEGMIRFAEYLSSKTCQNTGEAGSPVNKGGWWATLSPKEAKRLGFSVAKEQYYNM